MTKPLVTIITATYNLKKAGREKFFIQNLKSVHAQSYGNIEHLIVDGASTDGTLDILKEYEKKGWIRCISEPDKSIYEAMNKGIKKAEGEYIAFLNSDDFYHNKEAVRLSAEALEKNKADFSFANYIVTGKNQRYIEKGELERFIYIMPFGHPTMFAKTAVLRAEGGFDLNLGLPADYDLVIRLILKDYKSTYVNEEIVTYRLGGLGTTNDHSNEIGQVYLKNYSPFCRISGMSEAKKIMYEGILPQGFAKKFEKYAKTNNLKNLDLEKVMSHLWNLSPKDKSEVIIEKVKNYLKRYPIVMKIWKIIKH